MEQCRIEGCTETAWYQCAWKTGERICMKLVCYFHGREVDDGKAYCVEHWADMHLDRPRRLDYWEALRLDRMAMLADREPERFNAVRPARTAARRKGAG